MAKYSYTESGITFNNLDSNPSPFKFIPGKIIYNENDFEFANEDGIKPVVNAVEIDWNGAELSYLPAQGTKVVNTTGDLLSILINDLKTVG